MIARLNASPRPSIRPMTSHFRRDAVPPHWQTAAEILMLIAEHGGDLMMARIAMTKALQPTRSA